MFKLDWISALDGENANRLLRLSNKLAEYYANRTAYYDYISAEDPWMYRDYLPCEEIIRIARTREQILELGCGRASILKVDPGLEGRYTGLEFSRQIIDDNRNRFPLAKFQVIGDPYRYQLESQGYDMVFSFFVIEHTIFPNRFLEECVRLLRPGGILVVFAPNFFDNAWVVSQRVSNNLSGGVENLKNGDFKNAFTSLIYRKAIIPIYCRWLEMRKNRGFWINCDPACFYYDEILPDLDACYITSFKEIRRFLDFRGMDIQDNRKELAHFVKKRRLGFLLAKKK